MTTASDIPAAAAGFDPAAIRTRFPILQRTVHGRPLVYLDNAATTQKPQSVIDAVSGFYAGYNANVHRGVHLLSQEATVAFERTRGQLRRLVNAADEREIVYVRGTTEAINLVAGTWGRANLGPGDEVLLTQMEHHSNIVPWQLLREATGCELKVAPVNDRGEIDLDALASLLTDRTKLVAMVHVSNALGTVNPVRKVVELARRVGARVLVDGAQGMQHLRVDVRDLGCDFYTFSGHKMFGPTGIGALWGRFELLDAMPPWMGGGDMIKSVTFDRTTWNDVPHKFEAGTPNIAGVIGFGAAIDFLAELDMEAVAAHERRLAERALARLPEIEGLRLVGTADERTASISFVMDGVHPHDIGTILDRQGIAIRTGHHCTQPLMERFGLAATARASFTIYNSLEEVDALVEGLAQVKTVFG